MTDLEDKLKASIDESMMAGWKKFEERFDAIDSSIAAIHDTVAGVDTHIGVLEGKISQLEYLVKNQVTAKVSAAMKGIKDDKNMLNLQVQDLTEWLDSSKSLSDEHDLDNKCIIIRNMPILNNDDDLIGDVLLMFVDILEVSLHIVNAECFKAYGDKIPLVKVELMSEDDRVLILQNK